MEVLKWLSGERIEGLQTYKVLRFDRNLKPLQNTLLGMDYRLSPQSRKCSELFGDRELFRLTGM